ncbi:hypothetical protein WG219_11750 [Ectopseudomonas mendocina]|uniref:Rdx family protein n=1 Tax=Ectopseudomonas mendocina TaxID=300 RepID=A0ABZ2RCG3_ECTME
MNTHHQIQDAVSTLTNAFAPLDCHILAPRNGSFSFTVVNKSGIARHTQRLYPGQYSQANLQQVIDRAKRAING